MRRPRALAAAALLALAPLAGLSCSSKAPRPEVEAENASREAHGRTAVEAEDAGRALGIGSRNDVLFEEGFSIVSYDPPNDYRNGAFRWMGQRGHVRLRGHGDHAMSLTLKGWLHELVIRAKGVVTVYLDGIRLFDTGAVEMGHWQAEVVVPSAILHGRGWSDLIITVSAVAFHWSEPPALQVVVLNALDWSELR